MMAIKMTKRNQIIHNDLRTFQLCCKESNWITKAKTKNISDKAENSIK